jgi:hypothetical protein
MRYFRTSGSVEGVASNGRRTHSGRARRLLGFMSTAVCTNSEGVEAGRPLLQPARATPPRAASASLAVDAK